MDATCAIQNSIHVFSLVHINMCPGFWVHITFRSFFTKFILFSPCWPPFTRGVFSPASLRFLQNIRLQTEPLSRIPAAFQDKILKQTIYRAQGSSSMPLCNPHPSTPCTGMRSFVPVHSQYNKTDCCKCAAVSARIPPWKRTDPLRNPDGACRFFPVCSTPGGVLAVSAPEFHRRYAGTHPPSFHMG